MTTTRRILTALATTALLIVGSAALAAPAQADVDVDLLGVAVAHLNGTIDVDLLGEPILSLPNPLAPTV
ncbi:hypothetical protein ABZ442_01045 [Streptomyces triculaminicus]|uniref:hypothetical protein n=1 Tax=Streptomyces triculaminicus TaxID=2816232 RepID=UPI0033DE837A